MCNISLGTISLVSRVPELGAISYQHNSSRRTHEPMKSVYLYLLLSVVPITAVMQGVTLVQGNSYLIRCWKLSQPYRGFHSKTKCFSYVFLPLLPHATKRNSIALTNSISYLLLKLTSLGKVNSSQRL